MSAVLSAAFLAGIAVVITAIGTIGVAAFNLSNDIANASTSIQAELGTTAEEAERLAGIAANAWGNNFAESIEEAAGVVGLVRQQLGDLANDELQRATENAFRLADAFGIETSESIDAVKTLMEQFGLTSDQAFDFITQGVQKGLNSSGDLLDTIGEYSTQLANGGASAEQFFSLLESGLQGGVLGTDKAADAFKEFGLRIADDSDSTIDALESIGINYNELRAGFTDGSTTVADAFGIVLEALNNTDNEVTQFNAGVALLGTQFEDLGRDSALALSLVDSGLEGSVGATQRLDVQYQTLGDAVEGFKRRALLAFEPIGGIILDLVNRVMPLVESAFSSLEEQVAPAVETLAGVSSAFFSGLEEGMSVTDAFIEAIWDIAPQSVLDRLIQFRDDVLPSLIALFSSSIAPIIAAVAQFVSWKDILIILGAAVTATVVPALVSFVAATAPVIAAITLVVGTVALLRNAWESNFLGIRDVTQQVINFIVPLVQNAIQAIQLFWAENGQAITENVATMWATILVTVQDALNMLKNEIILPAVEAITTFWNENNAAIQQATIDVWNAILAYYKFIFDNAIIVLEAFRLAFEGDWRGFGETLRIVWDNVWDAVKNVLSALWATIEPILSGLIRNMVEKFTSTDWGAVGRNVVIGLANGIRSAIDIAVNAVTSVASAAKEAFEGALGIDSPSKVFDGYGMDTILGYVNRLNAGRMMVSNAMTGLIDTGLNAITSLFPTQPQFDNNLLMGGVADAIRVEPAEMNNVSVSNKTTIQTNRDPMQIVRASRHLDKLGALGLA